MGKCYNCGGEIVFRFIDGKPTPIHTNSSNGYCGNNQLKNNSDKSITFESFCTRTNCPQCGSLVFFLRHNGGSVWVDKLGIPWPKHACFDNSPEPKWIKQIREKSTPLNSPITGVVFSASITNKGIQLIVNGQKSTWYEVIIKSQNTSDFFIGKLLVIDQPSMKVIFSDFPTMDAISIDFIKNPQKYNTDLISKNPIAKKKSLKNNLKEIKAIGSQIDEDIQNVLTSASFYALVDKDTSLFDEIVDGLISTGVNIHAMMAWIFMVTGAIYENGKFNINSDYIQEFFGDSVVSSEVAKRHIEKFKSIKWTDISEED